MRVDGFNPANALSTRPSRPTVPPAESAATGAAQPAAAARPSTVPRVVEQPSSSFEYIPARQGPTQPVHGYANQALAIYQSMANLPDADADGVFGVDLFI